MKKNCAKKFISLILAGGMAVSALSGCGSSDTQQSQDTVSAESNSQAAATESGEESCFNAEGYPICDETITVAVAGTYDGGKNWNETTLIQEIENRLGIKLECTVYEQEEWPTQLSLMMASDELPDLIIHASISQTDANSYGAEGYFLPINEYLAYAPNLSAVLEEYPDYEAAITAPDGNIYGLSRINAGQGADIELANRQWIKQTWLDNLGLDYPETIEDFYNVLVAFRDEDANGNGDPNDDIPTGNCVVALQSAFGIFSTDGRTIRQLDENGNVYLLEGCAPAWIWRGQTGRYSHPPGAQRGCILTVRAQAETVKMAEAVSTAQEVEFRITLTDPLGKEIRLENGVPCRIEKPLLWWPNGLGEQPLYTVKVQLLLDGETVEEARKRIGLRTLTIERRRDSYGESFAHKVNGQTFFAMGADYIPQDNILSRITPKRTRRLLEDCKSCHFNVIRVWGGGYYPTDDFYDACDELGLVVWQEMMFVCAITPPWGCGAATMRWNGFRPSANTKEAKPPRPIISASTSTSFPIF